MRNIISIIIIVAAIGTLVVGIIITIDVVPGKPLGVSPLLWTILSMVAIGAISIVGVYWVEETSQNASNTASISQRKPDKQRPRQGPSPVFTTKETQRTTSSIFSSVQPSSTTQWPQVETSSRTDLTVKFGNLLRSEMAQKQLPPRKVALLTGVDENRILRLTTGEEIPSTQEAVNLFDAFNIPRKQRAEFLYHFEYQTKR